jgi:amino acid adenylation domain-containing protein
MVISILGVLKAGAAYIPLDPQYPADRLTFMLSDSHATLLLSQAHLVERLPASAVPTIRLDADWPQIARKKCDNPDVGVVGQNLAYVIYTSGSTGQPKGVQIEHHSACHAIAAHVAQFGLDQTSCVLQFASLSFDVSVAEIFSALVSGARLCLARLDTSTSLEEFVRVLREARVTLMMLPPSVWAIIPEVELPDLRTVISGGESCPAALVKRWGRGREFYNVYGPTEATICAAWARCEAADSRQPPIGRPVPNTQLYILDAFLRPVPIGLVGELYIGGVQLARGYLNRPELTAERFIRHPFSAEAGARLYRTGDLARYRSDGNIEFVRRADQQVKVRGFRIELGEIEAALLSHPSVHQAVVMAREDVPGDRRLVAYVVGDPAAVAATDLRAYLKAHLPDYMVPVAFVVMAELPLSPNGKINQRALPDPHQGRVDLEATFVVPQTEVERIIAATWQEVLDVDRIGIHDNFFDLGGHSLLIVQVYSKLRQVLDRAFSIIDLFQYPTICSLAKYLSTQLDELPSRHKIQDRAQQQKTALARQKQLVSKVRGIGE